MKVESQHAKSITVAASHEPTHSAQAGTTETNHANDDAVRIETGAQHQKGVLRNLLEGHYKGVADIRLRINFYDELQSLEGDHDTEEIHQEVGQLLEEVRSKFAAFAESDEVSEETAQALETLRLGFRDRVTELLSTTSISELASTVGAEGFSLIAQLQSLLTPAPQESTTDVAELTDPVDPVPSDAELFLTSLASLLDSSVDTLESILSENSVLPPLSEPAGQGAAYAKFLAIYNSLNTNGVAEKQETAEIALAA